QEPSVLRFAARERAVDRSAKLVGHSCAVGGGMRKEIRGVAHDCEANPLDVRVLPSASTNEGTSAPCPSSQYTSATVKPWSWRKPVPCSSVPKRNGTSRGEL